jgi:glycosyltransferase involved in cell wall biosynthesis
MRVALCVDALGPQQGGIGRYTWELAKGLANRTEIETLNYFGRGRLIDEPRMLIEGEMLSRQSKATRWINRWRLSRALRNNLVHGPNFFLPAQADQGIITVHDLSVFRYPETHPLTRVQAFERLFGSSLSRAAHVITDTETVKQELVESFSVQPESVTAIPLGVDERFRPTKAGVATAILSGLGLVFGGYGLCVSTLEPRKKILELILAWSQLPDQLRSKYPLVLAGGAGWENDVLHALIELGTEKGWLRHLGFVDEEHLPTLYAGAALFIYPSIYEGFGLPPIEAMACGAPVIVANRSCLPEVCGDAARYVNPDNIDDFSAIISNSLFDTEWRTRAVHLGLERARLFSWERCIENTIRVYQNVINSR